MTPKSLAKARTELERRGLLLEQDRERPSLVTLLVGEPVSGSWWGHAKGAEIFAVLCALADDPDVVVTKLVDGKVTLVHARLWPALVAVATAGEHWQTAGLQPPALRLLEQVRAEGPLSTDQLARDTPARRALAAAAKELERRLLVRSEQVHTESGAHARVLDTWERFAKARLKGRLPKPDAARAELEAAAQAQGIADAALPWGLAHRAMGVTARPAAGRRRTALHGQAAARPGSRAGSRKRSAALAAAPSSPRRASKPRPGSGPARGRGPAH